MKSILILFSLFYSSTLLACANFSGNYKSPEGGLFSIAQDQCNSITLTQDTGTYTAINDGQTHLSLKQDIVIEGQSVGTMSVFTKLVFLDERLILDLTLELQALGQTQTHLSHADSSLNANGDLVSVETKDGQTKQFISVRIR